MCHLSAIRRLPRLFQSRRLQRPWPGTQKSLDAGALRLGEILLFRPATQSILLGSQQLHRVIPLFLRIQKNHPQQKYPSERFGRVQRPSKGTAKKARINAKARRSKTVIRLLTNRLHPSRQSNGNLFENTAGILTYDGRKALHGSTLLKGSAKLTRSFNGYALPTIKYSNGGCSGFKPDSLTRSSGISTQHTTFQNRIFVSSMYFSLFYHIFVRQSTKKAAPSRHFLQSRAAVIFSPASGIARPILPAGFSVHRA